MQGMAFGRITGDPSRGRAPTRDEIRFQAIDSVAAGADAVIWYGTSSLDLDRPDDARLWDDLRSVAAELHEVRDAITGEAGAPAGADALWLRAHRSDGGLVVFVSHRAAEEATHRLDVGAEWTGVDVIAGPTPTRDDDGWSITFDGLEGAILRFDR